MDVIVDAVVERPVGVDTPKLGKARVGVLLDVVFEAEAVAVDAAAAGDDEGIGSDRGDAKEEGAVAANNEEEVATGVTAGEVLLTVVTVGATLTTGSAGEDPNPNDRVDGFAAVGAEKIDALEGAGADVAALVNPKEGWEAADVGVAKEKPVVKVDEVVVVVTDAEKVVLPDDTAANELGAKELPLPKEKGEVEMLVMAGEVVAVEEEAEEGNRGDAEEDAENGDMKDAAGADVAGREKVGVDEDVANEGTEGAALAGEENSVGAEDKDSAGGEEEVLNSEGEAEVLNSGEEAVEDEPKPKLGVEAPNPKPKLGVGEADGAADAEEAEGMEREMGFGAEAANEENRLGVVAAEDRADGKKRLEVVAAEVGADGEKRLEVVAEEEGADGEKRLEVVEAEDAADEEPKVEMPKRDGEEPAVEEAPRGKPEAEDEVAAAAVGTREKRGVVVEEREKGVEEKEEKGNGEEAEAEETEDWYGKEKDDDEEDEDEEEEELKENAMVSVLRILCSAPAEEISRGFGSPQCHNSQGLRKLV